MLLTAAVVDHESTSKVAEACKPWELSVTSSTQSTFPVPALTVAVSSVPTKPWPCFTTPLTDSCFHHCYFCISRVINKCKRSKNLSMNHITHPILPHPNPKKKRHKFTKERNNICTEKFFGIRWLRHTGWCKKDKEEEKEDGIKQWMTE